VPRFRCAAVGFGVALLFDAVRRSANSGIAVFAMVVDAKDAGAVAFHRHNGFEAYGAAPRMPVAPLNHPPGVPPMGSCANVREHRRDPSPPGGVHGRPVRRAGQYIFDKHSMTLVLRRR
jgi:hypothetical protein